MTFRTDCRLCKSNSLSKFLDLGHHPPSDEFITQEKLKTPVTYYPLDVYLCENCGQVQLGYIVPPQILFQNDYPYESSTTETARKHWFDFSKRVVEKFHIPQDSLVMDIGSNVGALLSGFKAHDMKVLGVDPASNIAAIANHNGIETINDFFCFELAEQIASSRGKASIITATNVFAHVDNLDAFVKSINVLLHDNGVFIIEAPHFLRLVEHLEYDTIYHEHLSYISLKPLVQFFKKFELSVFDVEEIGFHGGSLRIFIGRQAAFSQSDNVKKIIQAEEHYQLHNLTTLKSFAQRVEQNRTELSYLLHKLKHEGKTIAGLSAPAKGMTLLNYCGIRTDLMDFITEKAKLKIGKYTPGGHIPVLPDEALVEYRPDYALLLAWNFAAEIMNNLKDYKAKGGKFILPLPSPKIIE